MNPNEKYEQQSVQSDKFGETQSTVTRTVEGPRQVGLAPSTIAVIVIIALVALGTVLYWVNNNNENQEANRQAAIESSRLQAEAQARSQSQVPSQQPPVIIQQPAPTQQAPVVIQQPSAAPSVEVRNVVDDSTLQDAAAKRLSDAVDLEMVTVTVLNGKALLSGNVASKDLKTKAEQVVRAVQGVKSVENKITVSAT